MFIIKQFQDYQSLHMKQHYIMNLKKKGLEVKTQVGLPFVYEDLKLDVGYFS